MSFFKDLFKDVAKLAKDAVVHTTAEIAKQGKTALGYILEQAFTSDPGLLKAWHELIANPTKESAGYFAVHALLVLGVSARTAKIIKAVFKLLFP